MKDIKLMIQVSDLPTTNNLDDETLLIFIYREYSALMTYQARLILHAEQDADDAVSETFIKIHKKLTKIRQVERCKMKAYIVKMVKNTAYDMLDQRMRLANHPLNEDMADARPLTETMALDAISARGLALLIKQLPQQEQRTLYLHIKGYSDRDIASHLGISPSGARMYLSRARKRLDKWIKEANHEE